MNYNINIERAYSWFILDNYATLINVNFILHKLDLNVTVN